MSFDEEAALDVAKVLAGLVHMFGGDVIVPEEFVRQVEDEGIALTIRREQEPDELDATYRIHTHHIDPEGDW